MQRRPDFVPNATTHTACPALGRAVCVPETRRGRVCRGEQSYRWLAGHALYAKLAETGVKNEKKGLSRLTIRHVPACLHKACKNAVRWGYLSRNSLDAAGPPRKQSDGSREMKTWTKGKLRAFLDSVRDERLYALWHLTVDVATASGGSSRRPIWC